jgi:hypothetical protein
VVCGWTRARLCVVTRPHSQSKKPPAAAVPSTAAAATHKALPSDAMPNHYKFAAKAGTALLFDTSTCACISALLINSVRCRTRVKWLLLPCIRSWDDVWVECELSVLHVPSSLAVFQLAHGDAQFAGVRGPTSSDYGVAGCTVGARWANAYA